ncbi:electron transfer flavoprotein subunit beta/FixA family protein [Halobacteriaceae archaeon SHR40]|uniref:electron transfer flavoprotein subunit beta/FixA family protein n=1 Tax=Halovenus amylolytica TaxID=2500550 RepID=UPI000FE35A7D
MKILVTVTEVAIADDEFEINDTSIDETYLTFDLNEWDTYAIEEAVQLQETEDEIEVVTATVGPERVEETIRTALAKGADRAVRIWDESLEGETMIDPSRKAQLLAGVVEDEQPDLVLSGVQSGDVALGATGVALAEQVGFEWGAVVNQLDLDGDTARVHRELEGGVEELTEIELPAVLTIQTGINEPRYASLRGIRQAQSKPLDVRSPADLGVELEAASLELTDLVVPESESDTDLFEGAPEETAAQLAELLEEKGVGA